VVRIERVFQKLCTKPVKRLLFSAKPRSLTSTLQAWADTAAQRSVTMQHGIHLSIDIFLFPETWLSVESAHSTRLWSTTAEFSIKWSLFRMDCCRSLPSTYCIHSMFRFRGIMAWLSLFGYAPSDLHPVPVSEASVARRNTSRVKSVRIYRWWEFSDR
jgi:hypothetical protein